MINWRRIKSTTIKLFNLLFGTDVSRTLWYGCCCCCCCWNAGKVFWLLLKNVFVDVWDGGVARENKSSVNNWDVVCWPFDDDDDGCWEKKSVPPKPFPLVVAAAAAWVKAVGDEESLF